MQAVVPAQGAHNPNSHTETTILDALRGRSGTRRWSFRYEHLTSTGVVLGDLVDVQSGEVSQNWLADIKRTAKFVLRDTGDVDFLSDRVKPYVRLHLPPYGADDWCEWPQGVFLLSTPARSIDASGRVLREVQGYDQLQVYLDDRVTTRYTVDVGAVVTSAVVTLLGGVTAAVTVSASTLPTAMEWEPGTPKLRVINDLLATIAYESLSFDEDGVAIVQPYVAPGSRTEEYVYADDQDGLVIPAVDQELDLFSVPNSWVLTVSEPDRPALVSTLTNNDPSSPTSTVRRGRTIVDFRTEESAADQAALDVKVARLAAEASQIYEALEFETGLNPLHSGNDVYRVTYSPLAVDAKYAEHSWTMPLRHDATMAHRARRVVVLA